MRQSFWLKVICVLLLCCMAASLLAGCGQKDNPLQGETDTQTQSGENDTSKESGSGTEQPQQSDVEAKPDQLKINLLTEAWNVPTQGLRFSWRVPSIGEDTRQEAYRLVIGTDAQALKIGNYAYDSGWVENSDSTGVVPAGLDGKLQTGHAYVWSVSVRTETGLMSDFAEPVPFVTAQQRTSYPSIWASTASLPDSDDYEDLTLEAAFSVTSVALGFVFQSPNASNYYMWQFKLSDGGAQLNPHVFKDGKFVNNAPIDKVTIPQELAFSAGDKVSMRIVVEENYVTTYLQDEEGEYIEIDSRDMSSYGLGGGLFGVRTGGQESGIVYSMMAYHSMQGGKPQGVVYASHFDNGISPFPKCTVEDGALTVPKAISTGSLFDASLAVYPDEEIVTDLSLAKDEFAFFRRTFTLEEASLGELTCAVFEITAASPEPARQHVYQVWCNGTCLGVGPTREDKGENGETVLYLDAYSVLPYLVSGVNVISVLCDAPAGRQLFAALTLYGADGTGREVFSTADPSSWKTLAGNTVFRPNQSVGTNYYRATAENLDATVYPLGFETAEFSPEGWYAALAAGGLESVYTVKPSVTSPVRRLELTGEQTTVEKVGADYVIDLGQEIVGSFRLTVNVSETCEIELFFGERLNEDGTVKYQMNTGNVYYEKWKLREGEQTLENFDLLCYRYVQIAGCPVAITPEMVRGIAIRTDFDDAASSLSVDNALLQELWDLTKATAKYTTQSLYVDSQTRERVAYEGDALINQLVCAAFSDDYSVASFTIEYLLSHRTWPADYVLFMPIMAYDLYMRTGDTATLQALYPKLAQCQFTKNYDPAYGLLKMEVKSASSTDSILVDWPMGERFGYDMNVAYNTAFNALAVASYRALAALAEACGEIADSKDFAKLADDLTKGLIDHLYDAEAGVFYDGLTAGGTRSEHAGQHATSFALYAGVYKDATMRDAMAASIEKTGRIQASVYGAYFLLEGLYRSGHGEVANKLLLADDPEDTHTWAYMLSQLDVTLAAEAWNDVAKKNLSLSHPWGAAPAVAIVNGIFGIRPTAPGFSEAEIRLQPGELTRGSIETPTLRGTVAVSFEQKNEGWTVQTDVPANMDTTLLLPFSGAGCTVTLDGVATETEQQDGFACLVLPCGLHTVILTPGA